MVVRTLLLAIVLLIGGIALPAQAQERERLQLRGVHRVHLDDGIAQAEHDVVELQLRALARDGQPAELLPPWPIEIREDGRPVDPSDVEITTLAATDRGVTVVLAIDTSPTMGRAFDQVKKAASDFLDRLRDNDHVAVVAFAGEPRVVASFEDGLAAKRAEIRNLRTDDEAVSTKLFDGIKVAIDEIRSRPTLPRRALVVVFSDGGDSGSLHSLDEVVRASRGESGQARILLFTVGYPDAFGGSGLDVLRRLAAETDSEFLRVTSSIMLQGFFEDVWLQMMQSYLVRFPSDMDGETHTIEVEYGGKVEALDVAYPEGRLNLWPWLAALALLVLVVAVVWVLARRRGSPGCLILDHPALGQQTFPLHPGQVRVGAVADNDIVIDLPTVSRHHAILYVNGRRVEIEDAGSANGTFVNEKPVRRSALSSGDRVRLAEVELVYRQ